MITKEDSMKMIRVDDDTHKRLKVHGKFGESFQDIINRLLDIVEDKASTTEKSKK